MTKATTKARDARRGRLAQARAERLEDQLARLMRLAFQRGEIGYIGGLEAPLRHGIRASLCLGGWRWRDADAAARDTVGAALRRVRAQRPSWNEGQREWTLNGDMNLTERTRCVECHKPLEGEQQKFCSSGCTGAHHSRIAWLRAANEDQAVWTAVHSI